MVSFAEICLLANSRRITSARAASVCDLFVLPACSFKNILEEFPEVKVLVEHVAIHKLLDLRKHVSWLSYFAKELRFYIVLKVSTLLQMTIPNYQ